MKRRKNADDRLRKLERNRYNSLEDAALWVEENLRLGRIVFSRPLGESGKNGVMDLSNGYSIWVGGGGMWMAWIMANTLTEVDPKWGNGVAESIAKFITPTKVLQTLDSPLRMLRALPYLLPGFTLERECFSLHENPELLLLLAQEVSTWLPLENIEPPEGEGDARSRGMTWLG